MASSLNLGSNTARQDHGPTGVATTPVLRLNGFLGDGAVLADATVRGSVLAHHPFAALPPIGLGSAAHPKRSNEFQFLVPPSGAAARMDPDQQPPQQMPGDTAMPGQRQPFSGFENDGVEDLDDITAFSGTVFRASDANDGHPAGVNRSAFAMESSNLQRNVAGSGGDPPPQGAGVRAARVGAAAPAGRGVATAGAGGHNHVRNSAPSNNLYVGSLPYDFTDDDLERLCSPYGSVITATVMVDIHTGQSRGFGFVLFRELDDAISAYKALTTQGQRGETFFHISFSGHATDHLLQESNGIYVRNIPRTITGDRIEGFFEQRGLPPLSCRMLKDTAPGNDGTRIVALLEFTTSAVAKQALKACHRIKHAFLPEMEQDDVPILAKFAEPRLARQRRRVQQAGGTIDDLLPSGGDAPGAPPLHPGDARRGPSSNMTPSASNAQLRRGPPQPPVLTVATNQPHPQFVVLPAGGGYGPPPPQLLLQPQPFQGGGHPAGGGGVSFIQSPPPRMGGGGPPFPTQPQQQLPTQFIQTADGRLLMVVGPQGQGHGVGSQGVLPSMVVLPHGAPPHPGMLHHHPMMQGSAQQPSHQPPQFQQHPQQVQHGLPQQQYFQFAGPSPAAMHPNQFFAQQPTMYNTTPSGGAGGYFMQQ